MRHIPNILIVVSYLLILTSCNDDPSNPDTNTGDDTSSDSGSDSDTDTDSDSDTDTDTDSDSDTDTASNWEDTDTYDCDNQPSLPRPYRELPDYPFGEDFVFDNEGYLLNVKMQQNIFTKTTYDGTSTEIVPVPKGWIRGCRLLPDGDAVIAVPEKNQIIRVSPEGSILTLTTGIQANGIAIGMDGFLYVSCSDGQVLRVNPDTGNQEFIWTQAGVYFDGITFSPDYGTLYFDEEAFGRSGTKGSKKPKGHRVFKIEINDDGTPAGDATVFAIIETQGLLDGMTCDECGNIYVVDMLGALWQITPEGEADKAFDLDQNPDYWEVGFTAVNFGSGVGGWRDDFLYIPAIALKYKTEFIFEIDLGLKGKIEPHLQD